MNSVYNPKNERVKYNYKMYLNKAMQRDVKTVMAVLKHLHEYEEINMYADFSILNENIIHSYVDALINKDLSLSYIDHNLKTLRDFYSWLERQKGYKSKINYNHLAYFNLTKNQRKEARALAYQQSYKLEDIYRTIRSMPIGTLIERRDRAMISLQCLCGLRVSELRMVKIKNLIYNDDCNGWMVYVNPRDMNVKFAKTRHAFFMPFDEDIKENILNWRSELIKLGFSDSDPLFPSIPNQFNQFNLLELKPKKEEIKSNSTIGSIFKRALKSQGVAYHRVHNFRHMIAKWAGKQGPEVFNAVSQSLGHSDIKTTFTSYGALHPTAVGNILNNKEAFKR